MMTDIFNLFAVHYVFNLEYYNRLKDFFQFVKDKIAGIHTDAKRKRSAVYLNVAAGAECYLCQDTSHSDECSLKMTLDMNAHSNDTQTHSK